MSFAGDRVLEVKWGRNISCDQLVGIFSTGLLKGAVEMWIFHSFLTLGKEYFRVSDSVSERLSKKKKKVWGCYLMLQLSQCRIWQSESSSAACHHPWPCSLALLSAMAAVLILQSAVPALLFFSWSDHACLVLLHCLLNNSDMSV